MRNGLLIRKGGGAEYESDARSIVGAGVVASVAGVAVITAATAVATGDTGAAVSVTSWSRLVFGFDIVHCSAQHGIAACIVAIECPALSRQHTAAAGMAVTISTSTAAIIVAKRFVLDVVVGCTIFRTPAAVSVFRGGGRRAGTHEQQ